MAFDVKAALEAGGNKNDIIEYLANSRGFDLDGARKAEGYNEDDLLDYLANAPQKAKKSAPEDKSEQQAKLGLQLEQPNMEDIPDISAGVKTTENFLPDAGNVLMDTAKAMTVDLPDTLTNLGKLGAGGIQKAYYGAKNAITGGSESGQYEPALDAVMDYYKDNYFSGTDALAKHLQDHPAQFLADLSIPLTGGAGLARGAGLAATKAGLKAGSKLTALGKGMETAGRALDPLYLPEQAIARPLASGLRSGAVNLYENAMKIPPAGIDGRKYSPAQRQALHEYGLENGYLPNGKSMDRLQARKEGLYDELSGNLKSRAALEESGLVPKNIDIQDVLQESVARTVGRDDFKNLPFRETATDKLLDYASEIGRSHPGMHNTDFASSLKTGAQHQINWNRKGPAPDPIHDMFLKEYQRVLNDKVTANVPEAYAINQKLSALHEFEPVLDRAVGRVGNRDTLGAGALTGAITGGTIAAQSGANAVRTAQAAAGGALTGAILKNPNMAARGAVGMWHAAPVIKKGSTKARNRAQLGAKTGGLLGEIENDADRKNNKK